METFANYSGISLSIFCDWDNLLIAAFLSSTGS